MGAAVLDIKAICSHNVLMPSRPVPHPPSDWPRPPACLPAARLDDPPDGARVAVAGLVILRQRPGTAKGVIFVTLEDETGVVNVIVWRKVYERFRRAVIAGRLLRVTGRLQRAHSVTHVIAERIEDISSMLDLLLAPPPDFAPRVGLE
ncbi:DNA-directed RNA polymerase [Jhaorihella thermophila]|uniref:Error-prone DNA polymerase n=2 Tax=Jhaorihella thermophila TaxID=488547 RepID=A0A1H5W684_9RHOB|nr:DNA-directed RNA polymerase [Jhaorihella thermophila]